MAVMNHKQLIEQKIEENYRCRPWLGVVPVERAIEAAIAYRNGLHGETLRLFDEAITNGWLPERAIDMIEYAVERNIIPDSISEVVTKAS
jgi:hypothetical protein